MDAQQRQQNIANYQNAQLNYAGFQNDKFSKEFAYNQDEPYRNKTNAIRALYGAGMQNGANGLQTVADSGATLAGGQGGGGNRTSPYNYGGTAGQQVAQQQAYQPIPTYTTPTPNTVPTQQQWNAQNPNGYYVPDAGLNPYYNNSIPYSGY